MLAGAVSALLAIGCDGATSGERNAAAVPFGQLATALERDLSLGATGDDVAWLQDYLMRYGYFPNGTLAATYPAFRPVGANVAPGTGTYDEQTRMAVLAFQGRAGITKTGVVNLETRRLMMAPRCGVPEGTSVLDRGSRFPLHGSTWSKTALTWFVANPPAGLHEAEVTNAIREAFASFQSETNLGFSMVENDADIEIAFDHIDGAGGRISRAAFPADGGDITLDSAEAWSTAETTPPDRLDLRTAALHQLGHALGMVHSVSSETIMYPYLRAGEQRQALGGNDRVAISAMYDSWREAYPGGAQDVGIGANGEVWVVLRLPGSDAAVVATSTATGWQQLPGDFSPSRITVSREGAPWICDEQGSIRSYARDSDTGQWIPRPGCCVDLGAGADGSIWAVGCPGTAGGGRIYKWNGTDWNEASGDLGGMRIAVGPNGVPWLIDNRGTIYRRSSAEWSSGSWNVVSGLANDIAIGPDRAVWAIGAVGTLGGYKLYLWNDSPADATAAPEGSWVTVIGGATQVAVGPGGPWVVNSWGAIWQQTAAKPPYQ